MKLLCTITTVLFASVSAQTWPLMGITKFSYEGTITNPSGTISADTNFVSGGSTCDVKQRTHQVLQINNQTITQSMLNFINSTTLTSTVDQQAGDQPASCFISTIPSTPAMCEDFVATGKGCTNKGTAICSPDGYKCDVWSCVVTVQPGHSVTQTFYFASGTSTVVSSTSDNGPPTGTSTVTYSKWVNNPTFPASTWVVPASWQPCNPVIDKKSVAGGRVHAPMVVL